MTSSNRAFTGAGLHPQGDVPDRDDVVLRQHVLDPGAGEASGDDRAVTVAEVVVEDPDVAGGRIGCGLGADPRVQVDGIVAHVEHRVVHLQAGTVDELDAVGVVARGTAVVAVRLEPNALYSDVFRVDVHQRVVRRRLY